MQANWVGGGAELPHGFETSIPIRETDAFVVMPNHIHGIIVLVAGEEQCGEIGVDGPDTKGRDKATVRGDSAGIARRRSEERRVGKECRL